MKIDRRSTFRAMLVIALMLIITIASSRLRADSGTCGGVTTTVPFIDVAGNPFFCQIAEAYFSGLANGTSPTTYSPSQNVLRDQMAAFVTRTLDQSLRRGSRRASLKQFWTPTSAEGLGLTAAVGSSPELVESDGADLWAASVTSATVSRVRASDAKILDTWTGATSAFGVLPAKGLIFATGNTNPGSLYQIDPTQPAGAVSTLSSALGGSPRGLAFDGSRIWTANALGSVSIVTLNPVTVTNVTTGFTEPIGILYDGANMWVTDRGTTPGKMFKLDQNGAIIQTVTVGDLPSLPVFDGTNFWVPNSTSNSVTVIRASTGDIIATLTGNGLSGPFGTAFDGERILVTNQIGSSVSVWKASDLTPLGFVSTGVGSMPQGACSDGLNFWISLLNTGKLARF